MEWSTQTIELHGLNRLPEIRQVDQLRHLVDGHRRENLRHGEVGSIRLHQEFQEQVG